MLQLSDCHFPNNIKTIKNANKSQETQKMHIFSTDIKVTS